MILKIKTPAQEENSWHFYDGVHSLFIRQLTDEETRNMAEHGGGYITESPDHEKSTAYMFDKSCELSILYMSFDHHGAKYEVYAGKEVYLLNEHGRTIERMH